MSQADYDTKLRNVHRFIPFLENMITQLKDPKMKNREQQLSKMESLYQMITDKKKKLKIDTLQKCEEVIVKLYYKVKGQNAALPPIYSPNTTVKTDDKRKPIDVYSLGGESIGKSNEMYASPSGCSSSNSKSPRPKSFPFRKPPISYSDLECLEKDVAHELEKKMSLNELNTLRNRLFKELEDSDEINTTVRNKPVLAKLNATSPDKNKKKIESTVTQPKSDVKKDPTIPKKTDVPKVAVPKVLKEADLFCNAFSEIDKTYEMGLKKKDERRLSANKEKKEAQIEDIEKTSLKQLSEKAAQLRNNIRSTEVVPTVATNSSKPQQDQETPTNSKDVLANSKDVLANSKDVLVNSKDVSVIPLKISCNKTEDSNEKDIKEKSKSSKESSNNDRESKHSDNKKDKSEKGRKSDHKKDDKHKEKSRDRSKKDHDKDKERKDHDKDKDRKDHDKDKDRKDRSKDKNSREKSSKATEKDVKDKKSTDKDHDSKKDKNDTNKGHGKDNKKLKGPDGEEAMKIDEIATKQDVPHKTDREIEIVNKENATKDDLAELTKKIEEIMNANPKTQQMLQAEVPEKPHVQEEFQTQKKPTEETKPVNRDPRLKYGTNAVVTSATQNPTSDLSGRLAFKYNPKPKRLEMDNDLEKDILDSIEKSMKESSVPLPPPPKLIAPPAPPDDLFSPESPDEIDKAAVPPILNDLLLNPETTGVINEVVSALRRSNNEKNLISIATTTKICNDPKLIGQPILNQSQGMHFSPPPHGLKFTPPTETSIFVPPKQMMNSQPRGFNLFSPTEQSDLNNDRNISDYPLPRNQGPRFEVPTPVPNPYEDRANQGFFMERPLNYVPPSPIYVPPSPSYVPPSPSYVPPSPIYEANTDNYREMNYQNYQGSNQQQRFFEGERGMTHTKGLLGDAPRLPYNKSYGQMNYDNYSRFGPRGNAGNSMDQRSSYYSGVSRDPRINISRAPQFPVQEPRPMYRENRMTYREHKEQKERENREREMREKEIREKEALEKQQRDREEADKKAKAAKDETEKNQKEAEIDRKGSANSEKVEEREKEGSRFNDRSERDRSRNRSRDRYSRNRSSSRYRRDRDDRDDWRSRGDRKDRDDRRGRSRERSRYGESKFDKVYSTREKMDKDLPLNSLFTSKTNNGKGYGTPYKIPKKVKEEEPVKVDDKTNEAVSKEVVKKDEVGEKKKVLEKTADSEKTSSEKKHVLGDENDVIEIKKNIEVIEIDKIDQTQTQKEKPTESKVEEKKAKQETDKENKTDSKTTEEITESSNTESDKKQESKEEKTGQTSDKKDEEENILSKFFQNLMKSSNKDEKKGALLSLISTFSDSFSNQQMEKITNIIKSGDVDEPMKKDDQQSQKEDMPTTSKDEIEKNEEKETESITEGTTEKIEEETETNTEEEIEPNKEEVSEINKEEEEVVASKRTRQTTAGKEKNRRKSEIKSKIKIKSELDRLHDDIRDMFIRDGVVTATGKRMCRILKDTSAPSSTDNDKVEEEHAEEETEKKTSVTKRKGRKVGWKKNRETPDLEMKELTVVLPKMSLEKIKSIDGKEKNEEDLNSNEEKVDESEEPRDPLGISEDETSEKETEVNKEKTSPIRKGRQRKRNSWATGVIKKKPCPKSRKQKVLNSPERNNSSAETELELSVDIAEGKDELPDKKDPNLHDKDYYLKVGQTNLPCKLCNFSTKWIAAHYRTEHPEEDVLCSRLPPDMAKVAIDDAIENKDEYENDEEESLSKHEFVCSFCEYKQVTLSRMYRDHVSIHTGEFRHKCPYCNFSRSHIKTMQGHVAEAHAEEEAVEKKAIISQRATNNRNIYAHICQICNFTQMSLENVERHVRTYHPDAKKCNIFKIKLNLEAKLEETKKSERPTRRSAKLIQLQEEHAVVSDATSDVTKQNGEDAAEKAPPQISNKKEDSEKPENELDEEVENSENSNSKVEEESADEREPRRRLRQTRKRGKSFSAPSPVKKRLKRKCTLKIKSPSEDAEDETSEEKVVKNIDVAVFTSNTDIQEENKRIEEERMKTMQDINSTIKLRASLDFVEKLSHRLKQEEEVIVKQEVEEAVEEDVLEKLPANDLPVFEKSVLQNREVEQTPIRQESSPKQGKDGARVNPINGVIEKLQGILGSQSASCDDIASPIVSSEELSLPAADLAPDDVPPPLEAVTSYEPPPLKFIVGESGNHPPPLIHMDNVEQTIERSSIINSETLNIGLVKIMKTLSTYIYVCCLPPCIFSTRDRAAFASHCQKYHKWDQNSLKTSECLECGLTLTSGEDTNLLTSALNHAVIDHSDFLGTKIGSIRISSNLFPNTKSTLEENDTLSDNALLNLPTISIPSPPGGTTDDIDSLLDTETVTEDNDGENPFELRIVDVVSLADENLSPLRTSDQDVETQISDKESGPNQPQEESTPLRVTKKTSISTLLLKYQSKQTAIISRKTPVALKKFLGNHFDLYKCPDYSCLFTTNKRKMFDIHLRMHPNHRKLMNCLYCDKLIVFETTGDHYENMHGMCRFSCSYCLYRCIAKDYMDIHQILAHSDVPSRMQLLPKRDSEDKNSISILSEATKGTPIKPFLCCSLEFTYQVQFVEHVNTCPQNMNFSCHFKTGNTMCEAPHNSARELVQHWGTCHGVYPLKCHYCDTGDFDLNAMMIHLVLEHPTLPPDIVDRYNPPVNKSKKPSGLSSVQCNFKQLAIDLKSNLKGPCTSTPESPPIAVLNPTIVTTKPSTMQKAFENFVVQKTQPGAPKGYSKVKPISILQKSPPQFSLLKPTSKANVMNAGGVVYCLSSASSSQNQVLKAIVVNSDNTVGTVVPQKVHLVPSSPTVDGKFQIIKNISKMVPIAPKMVPIAPKGVPFAKMPKLAPLTNVQQHISPINKVIGAGETVTLQLSNAIHEGRTLTNEELAEASTSQKDSSFTEDSAEMEGLEEPMVVFRGGLGNTRQDEEVDPLSLEMEDPLIIQPPKSPHPNATPSHEYDSDSKDVDQQDVLVQKSGLVGYQLFRCAKCEMFFHEWWQLKDHLINSTQCKFDNVPNKPYKCYHCGKYLKQYTNLLEHLGYHGPPRFTCSLCNKKFPHANQAKYHMKTQHSVLNVQMQPSNQSKSNINIDNFIAKPQVVGSVKPVIQENKSECDPKKSTEVKTVYFSFEADQIPQKSILGYDVTCGHCKKFKNKVRSNIVRHLLLHQNDKEFSVPDTAPVNPVPCLEKNEKMFDKMYNLASSSHTGGRMGGQQKGETKKDKIKETNDPAFVPTNKRYQCCAVGCNYLCLEEGNLRHHLTALHMEDLNFVCVHCKRDLSDAVDVDTIIKHLKLHDLHLYKCSHCDYMHNLKHKIERHIGEDHKNKETSVVVIRAMDAEPYDDNQQQPFTPPVVVNQKLQKLWKCCMCKYKCHTEEEVVNHCKNKHNIDCRYKCALCTFKTNEVSEFNLHFTNHHPDSDIDFISVYHKDDEGNGTVTEVNQFDTTPLWLRDKPRVRHIRGILFEEDPAMKKKSAQLKSSSGDQVGKESAGTSLSKKRKRSMSTFNESNKLEEEFVEPKKEVTEVRTANIQGNNDVIVIDDDEEEEQGEKDNGTVEPSEEQENDIDLICMFGDVGMPLNKHFKCPKCEKYKTTKMKEFVQHVAGEVRYHRFMCKICQEKFITLENIQMHCIDYHDCSVSSVSYLPIDQQLNKWLTLLLKEQRTIIKNLGFACEEIPPNIEDFLGRMEVIQKMIKCKECGFSVSGMQALDRHMRYNHPHIAFSQPASSSTPDQSRAQTSTATDKKRRSEEPPENAPETKKLKTITKTNLIAKDKYVCNECKAEFNSVPEMEFHGKEIHEGNVSYSVKTTNIPISLGVNRNIYRCRYCPTTGTKANLEIHISTDHPGQKIDLYRFSCGVCSAKFEMLKGFRHHFKSHELPEMFYHDVHDKRVMLKSAVNNSVKNKLYKCPVCSYCSRSINTANIKHHLKLHAKPFKCELCQSLFKTRSDAKTHHSKEHPHNTEVISTCEEMVQKLNRLMEEVTKNVRDVEVTDKTYTDESMEEDVSFSTLQPEVILKTAEDEAIDVESMDTDASNKSEATRYFARKSTGVLKKPEEEYYSFYGEKAEPVDMKKIITNFEIADAKMKMTCDQLSKIYNLNPIVRLKDCMTLIIEDDDDVSS